MLFFAQMMATGGQVPMESMLYFLPFISSLNYSIHYGCSEHAIFEIELEQIDLDLIFVKFPHLISPISVHPPLGKSDHVVLCWTYTSALPQLPPRPDKINPARINIQTIATLALECR